MIIYMDYEPIIEHFTGKDPMGWLDDFYPELEFNLEEHNVLAIDGDDDDVISFANHMTEVTWAFEDIELSFPLIHQNYDKLPF